MPLKTVKHNWVAITVVAAIAVGTGLSFHNVDQVDQDQKADQIEFNVGACERGNVLRASVNQQIENVKILQGASQSAIGVAAESAVSEEARAAYAVQEAKLAQLKFENVELIECDALVESQTPR